MTQWRYLGPTEVLYLEPEPYVLSPGDVVEADSNPDPERFVDTEAGLTARSQPRSR